MANILVVDDEMGIRALLQEILTDEGHSVELAENAAQARTLRERQRPDLVLLDIWMPDVDGITLLKEWGTGSQLNMPVIMMSGHGTIDTAVEATKYGAMAFLEKPITLQKLLRAVEQGLSKPAPRSPAPAGMPGLADGPSMGGLPRIERADYLPAAEAAHYATPSAHHGHAGGATVTPSITMASGPQAEQIFLLDRPLREARDAFEKAYFEFHLARENGSMTRVAERTGLERTHLYRKLKQLGVDLSRNKRGAS
ncbi:MAG: sigma-54-dependent Fis family transcriptional regulator [Sphaerotilus sp.]|jgi:DNA-binding NtrC family response regulator|nr:sigma-54-dependent Fis family transcriptional regulator [Sphaerotilus sp.]